MADPRRRQRALVLDMEGVLHVDWTALPGSPEAVRRFAASGVEIAVLTNTTGRTRAEIAGRLAGLGMPVPAERIVTSASATAAHLRDATPTARVYALAEPGVLEEFAGLDLVDRAAQADTIVLGGPDDRWTYAALNEVFAGRLAGLGMPVPAERIVTSASATAAHLRDATPTARVYALAEPGVLEEFAGLDLVDRAAQADTIVLGGPDDRWTYAALNEVFA